MLNCSTHDILVVMGMTSRRSGDVTFKMTEGVCVARQWPTQKHLQARQVLVHLNVPLCGVFGRE